MVGGDAIHVASLLGNAAKEIAASDNDGDLHTERMNIGEFGSDFVDAERVDSEALRGGEGLAGKFEEDAFENWFGHAVFNITAPTLGAKVPVSF